jgi:hypothetical protein
VAQQVNVVLVDDLDGSEATDTVTFTLDARTYEIDLSDENAAKLRDTLAQYIAAARRESGTRRSVAARTQQPAGEREQTAAIRQWARENGLNVSERGRIPKSVAEAFANRDRTPAPEPVTTPEPEPVVEAPKKRSRLQKIADPFRTTEAVG